jgi:hypothetical protein
LTTGPEKWDGTTVGGSSPPSRRLLARARSGRGKQAFMITGFGVHDRTDWPFNITGMRSHGVGTNPV